MVSPVNGGTTASRPWIASRIETNAEMSATVSIANVASANVKNLFTRIGYRPRSS
jgi:hypothetical protein